MDALNGWWAWVVVISVWSLIGLGLFGSFAEATGNSTLGTFLAIALLGTLGLSILTAAILLTVQYICWMEAWPCIPQ